MLKDFIKESFIKEKDYFSEVIQRTPQIWTFVMNTLLKEYQQQENDIAQSKQNFNKNLQEETTHLVKSLKELYETISEVNFVEKKKSENVMKKLNDELSVLKNYVSENNNKDACK